MLALTIFFLSLGARVLADATTTTNIFLPVVASQALVASLSRSSGDIKTLIVKCPDGTENCGFATAATVTAGPSTVELTTTLNNNALTVNVKCGIDRSTKASCTQIYTGAASLFTTRDGLDGGSTTTWTSSVTLESGSVTFLPVTITAGLATNANVNSSSVTSSKMSNGTATRTGGAGPLQTPLERALLFGLAANIAASFL